MNMFYRHCGLCFSVAKAQGQGVPNEGRQELKTNICMESLNMLLMYK